MDDGETLALRLVRFNHQPLDVVVPAASRVVVVKREVERVVAAEEEPSLGGRRLSWRHVWKHWTLACDGRELSDPRALLTTLGIASGSELSFHARIRTRPQRVTSVTTARGKKRGVARRRQ